MIWCWELMSWFHPVCIVKNSGSYLVMLLVDHVKCVYSMVLYSLLRLSSYHHHRHKQHELTTTTTTTASFLRLVREISTHSHLLTYTGGDIYKDEDEEDWPIRLLCSTGWLNWVDVRGWNPSPKSPMAHNGPWPKGLPYTFLCFAPANATPRYLYTVHANTISSTHTHLTVNSSSF